MSISTVSPAAAADYRPFPNEDGRNYRQENWELPAMVRVLGLAPRRRILEIGCGQGIALPVLSRLCDPERLVGIDIDTGLVDRARRRLMEEDVDGWVAEADARDMPFEDASFDLVVDFGTIYHIASPELALDEVARVLEPGGVFAHETRLSQLLSHPVRSAGRFIPWAATGDLRPDRWTPLWASRARSR